MHAKDYIIFKVIFADSFQQSLNSWSARNFNFSDSGMQEWLSQYLMAKPCGLDNSVKKYNSLLNNFDN
jgi:hypothetical protein